MIVFVNRFVVHGDPADFERAFADTAAYFTRWPGYIGNRLVRALDDAASYANIAEWESADALRAATRAAEFDEHARRLRALARSEQTFYEPVTGPAGPTGGEPAANVTR
ncbi:antibiotic biosynthesis monooxygenase family protein [Actinomadura violacea]|uniref:Antibiotic biosynthesis monooxygenase n=1 Tax=Actinomadura violacea TaxID=2819934 RepID=A0ABS3S0V7_9ACTN|nr:antibiotic biosynthesis monooxygenase family protein [Actinomadura violacea]MBO2462637.1 antibiotic biosynthesis monooxygenase [Actinomadura violacea]